MTPASAGAPLVAGIVGATAGPGSEIATSSAHGFASEDQVNITGVEGITGVDSPTSGGWFSVDVVAISAGPDSIVTLSRPAVIPPGTQIMVGDGIQPPGDPNATPPVPPGVEIIGATVGPNSVLRTSSPHGFADGDAVVVSGVLGLANVNSPLGPGVPAAPPWVPALPGPAIPWVARVVDDLHFEIDNGATVGVYASGGTASAHMAGADGLYTSAQYSQLSPTTLQIQNGATIGASHSGAVVTWYVPLKTSRYKIAVTGPRSFTIPNGPTGGAYASGGAALDVGP